jgi:DNA-binding winged helix-turn-helix (wHTH) protein/predicted ATPase
VSNERRIHFHPFALDRVNLCLWKDSDAIRLRPKAFGVLDQLVSRAGELVSKEDLINAVWQDSFVGDAVLKVAIRQIREALSDDPRSPRFIETAHRRGYRFIAVIGPPIPTAPIRDESAGVSSPARLRPGDLPEAIVGREHALARMHAWLERARRGERQMVFVTGEAGIGKTTLLERFARGIAPDRSVRVCSGQCLAQYGMSEAYLPVLDAIQQLCHEDAPVVEVLRAHAPMWLMQMPSIVTPADRELFGREAPGTTRERMLREMGEALDALTAHSTLVLVLEDLHWSDFSTLDLLSYVARRQRAARLMVIGTYRPAELIASRHPLKSVKQELVARRQCEELPLEYLTREAVGQHLAIRFPGNRFPPDLVALIHERTDGNPLFMVNTIDHLIQERLIEAHEDGWQLTAPIDAVKLGVPDSIRQLIETQVDRLDARDQRILEAASVAGTEFSVAAVSAALGGDLANVEMRCEELGRRHQFIRECGAQLMPDGHAVGRFGFVHAVYRHVLYDRMSASRRMHLHQRIGQRDEELYGVRANEIAAELAMHFERANDHARASRYSQQAGVNAMHRSAYREAIAASRRGLELLAALPDTDERALLELRLLITLGVPLIATEGYAAHEVGSVYVRARTLCERLGTAPELSQALWGLWTFHVLKAELSAALGIAGELLRLAERVPYSGVAMRAHWAMEITRTHQGNFRLALEHFYKALALYGSDRDRDDLFVDALNPGVAVRCFAGWCLWFVGQPDRGLAQIQEAVALARQRPEPHGLAHALFFASVLHQLRRDRQMAQRCADDVMTLAGEHGLVLYGAAARIVRAWALIGRGDDAEAAEQMRQGLAAWKATGAELMRPHFLALLAEAYAAANQHEQALQILDEALALAESTGEGMYEAEVWRLRGEHILAAGKTGANVEAAEACFGRALAIASRQGARSLELRAATSLARLQRDHGKQAQAEDLLLAIYEQFEEGFDTPDVNEAQELLGQRAVR